MVAGNYMCPPSPYRYLASVGRTRGPVCLDAVLRWCGDCRCNTATTELAEGRWTESGEHQRRNCTDRRFTHREINPDGRRVRVLRLHTAVAIATGRARARRRCIIVRHGRCTPAVRQSECPSTFDHREIDPERSPGRVSIQQSTGPFQPFSAITAQPARRNIRTLVPV